MPYFEDMTLVLFDEVKITAGSWLDISILGIDIRIPPWDIVLLPRIAIPFGWIWDMLFGWLDKMAEEYYAEQEKE